MGGIYPGRQEYDVLDSDLQLVIGGCVPTVLSFGIKEEGEYILQEYWEPRGGSYYAADIRDKFPPKAAEAILTGMEDYSGQLKIQCDLQAKEIWENEVNTNSF